MPTPSAAIKREDVKLSFGGCIYEVEVRCKTTEMQPQWMVFRALLNMSRHENISCVVDRELCSLIYRMIRAQPKSALLGPGCL